MFIVALLMIPKGRVWAWSTILTVMAVMTGAHNWLKGHILSPVKQIRSKYQNG